jgi:hypothetical protein
MNAPDLDENNEEDVTYESNRSSITPLRGINRTDLPDNINEIFSAIRIA